MGESPLLAQKAPEKWGTRRTANFLRVKVFTLYFLPFTYYITPMAADDYRDALKRAKSELDELINQRTVLEGRVKALQLTIQGLSILTEETDHSQRLPQEAFDDSVGITDAIRTVLQQSKMPMTAPQIRDALLDRGYDTERYASILTVIHNTVKRMQEQKEILTIGTDTGRFLGWRYLDPPLPAAHPAMKMTDRSSKK